MSLHVEARRETLDENTSNFLRLFSPLASQLRLTIFLIGLLLAGLFQGA